MILVCFVCLGNICRSPLAHGVFESLVRKEGLENKIRVSSAGTGHWHVGNAPDSRMQATAKKHGIHMNTRAQQFQASDFQQFDLVLAMDESNLTILESICRGSADAEKLRLFRSFDPQSNGDLDVPDPYYGGPTGFETVFQIVDRTCPKILEYLKPRLNL